VRNISRLFATAASAALLGIAVPGAARAAQFTLDFNTAPDGSPLDAYALDTHGNGDRTDVGNIWNSIGIDITATNTSAPLGLFNSNCLPRFNGVSDNVDTDGSGGPLLCNVNDSLGDPDLATGTGSYTTSGGADAVSYDSEPQGKLLILEENPGNGIPDDTSSGGTISFDFDPGIVLEAVLQEFVFVDNASGSVELFFTDGTSSLTNFSISGENELFVLTAPSDKSLSNFNVHFNDSGGIGAVVFSEYEAIPEGETALGLLVAGGLLGDVKVRQRLAAKRGSDARTDG